MFFAEQGKILEYKEYRAIKRPPVHPLTIKRIFRGYSFCIAYIKKNFEDILILSEDIKVEIEPELDPTGTKIYYSAPKPKAAAKPAVRKPAVKKGK